MTAARPRRCNHSVRALTGGGPHPAHDAPALCAVRSGAGAGIVARPIHFLCRAPLERGV